MTTAEKIVKDYLERGCSLEALRLLAESRPHPLGSEMLAVLDAMEVEAVPVTCETGTFSAAGDDMVFFVSDDEDAASDAEGINFDLMAATRHDALADDMAQREESVADILVVETEGAEVLAPAHLSLGSPKKENAVELGIWSRLWSRVKHPGAPDASVSREEEPTPVEAESGRTPVPLLLDAYVPEVAAETAPAASASPAEVGVDSEASAAETDTSTDYIPGSTSFSLEEPQSIATANVEDEKQRLLEAQRELLRVSAVGNSLNGDESGEGDGKAGRKARRRRERALKKKQRQSRKTDAALPEIVLACGEGTDTMVPDGESILAAEPSADSVGDGAGRIAVTGEETDSHGRDAAAESAEPALLLSGPMDGSACTSSSHAADAGELDVPGILPDVVVGEANGSTTAYSLDCSDTREGASTEETAEPPLPLAEECMENSAACGTQEDGTVQEVRGGDAAADDRQALFSGVEHFMIVAGGGMETPQAEQLSSEENRDEGNGEEAARTVILFHDRFPVFSGMQLMDEMDEEEDEEASQSFLRMLPFYGPVADDTHVVAENAEESCEPVADMPENASPARAAGETGGGVAEALTPYERLCLLRAVSGGLEPEDAGIDSDDPWMTLDEHVIMRVEPEPVDLVLEREAAVRAEMESEYQSRLDSFAARLLEVQAATAESEGRVREKKAELDAKNAVLAEMRKHLADAEGKNKALAGKLDEARRDLGARQAELERIKGMQDEHQRLYAEFEDLRTAYNEVVTDIMPGLQSERDDLALTVERQCESEKNLRGLVSSSRKRMAASYVLSAAACLMLVALPVVNWLKSGGDARELALDQQMVSELRENYSKAVEENIRAKADISELTEAVEMARSELDKRNREISRLAKNQSSGIAVFKPTESGSGGTPARASEMALQATTRPGERLRVNEVRDPAGSIESVVAHNRMQQERNAPRLAQAPRSPAQPIPLRTVASTQGRRDAGLRPSASAPSQPASVGRAVVPAPRGATAGRGGEQAMPGDAVTAKVKKGEGVAQVVYRVLGTWDPEVVAWVIRENNIRTDRRGNPVIQPEQELRLPKNGRVEQAASAARRR